MVAWKASDGTLTGPFCVPGNSPNCSSALPVTLLKFTAHWNENKSARISWTTASEVNNDYFEVWRSEDGMHYDKIGMEQGSGNSTSIIDYSFTDDSPVSSAQYLYYRLQQVDFDGRSQLYGPIALKSITQKFQFVMTPNPLPKNTPLHILLSEKNTSKITFSDAMGRIVYAKILAPNSLSLNIALPSLSPGLYHINCEIGQTIEQQKLIIVE